MGCCCSSKGGVGLHRFFLEKDDMIHEETITVQNKDSVRHLSLVLRVQINEQVELVSNHALYIGEIVGIDQSKVLFNIIQKNVPTHESNVNIDLYQCLPKGAKLELILQKNVELGVNHFVLVDSKRCIVDYKAKDVPKKLERFERIIKEAAKQSKRDQIPSLEGVLPIKHILERIKEYDLFIVLYENEEKTSLKALLSRFNAKLNKVAVFIGPEGGLDDTEIDILKSEGAVIASLGSRILRTETAGFVATTCIQYETGGLE